MNTRPSHPTRAAAFLAALAMALALCGCGRALSTSPDTGLSASPASRGGANANGMVVSDGGSDGGSSVGQPGTSSGGDTGDNPVVAGGGQTGGSSGPGVDGTPTGVPMFQRAANKLVKPNREVALVGGRWTLGFHSGSIAAKRIFAIEPAADGSMRVQVDPSSLQFNVLVDLTVSYAGTRFDPSSPLYTPGATIAFYRYDPVSHQWRQTSGVLDVPNRLARLRIKSTGIYGMATGTRW
jgi:hypothetical protein